MLLGRKEGRTKVLVDTSVKAKIEAAFATRMEKKRRKKLKQQNKKTKKQDVKEFGEKSALRLKIKLQRF